MSAELDSVMKSADTLLDMCGKLTAERDRLKAANAELANALEHCAALLLTYEINHIHGDEISDAALKTIRAALTKHQGATT